MRSRTPGADEHPNGPGVAELYCRWWPVVRSAARECVACDATAEDAASRVFLRLCRRTEPVAVNSPHHYFRRAGRREALQMLLEDRKRVPLPEGIAAAVPDRAPSPYEAVVRSEFRNLFRHRLATLPPGCRAVMSLILDGLTQAEVAERLGISVKAVEKQVRRGRRLLAPWAERTFR